MGWKTIKEKYQIKHIVQLRDGKICIGSGYIGDIIAIDFSGKITKGRNESFRSNDDLRRYLAEMLIDEQSGELKRLVDDKDLFEKFLPIYTIGEGSVIKKYCEKYDYPNVCNDGELIYENTFFRNKSDAKKYLLNDTRLGVKSAYRSFKENVGDHILKSVKITKYLFNEIWYYIKARIF